MADKRIVDGISAVVVAVFFVLFSGCDKTSDRSAVPQASKDSSSDSLRLKENIGWVHGTCLAIQNGKIKPGAPIQVLLLSSPQKIVDARVTASIAEPDSECFALLGDRAAINKQDGRFFYKLDISKESLNVMAISFVSASVKTRKLNSTVEFDLNNDGVPEQAGSCLTSEGVQFYISSSVVFNDKALWSDYYYLGYDNKPTCL